MGKPILCLDFDGVLHSYTSGWKGSDVIPDPPVPGAMEFIVDAVEKFEVHIFSSRSSRDSSILQMKSWLKYHLAKTVKDLTMAHEVFVQIKWPVAKPPAFLAIDDRALTFTGVFPDVAELLAFKPWNKQLKTDSLKTFSISVSTQFVDPGYNPLDQRERCLQK